MKKVERREREGIRKIRGCKHIQEKPRVRTCSVADGYLKI